MLELGEPLYARCQHPRVGRHATIIATGSLEGVGGMLREHVADVRVSREGRRVRVDRHGQVV